MGRMARTVPGLTIGCTKPLTFPLPGGMVMQRWATAPDGERWSLRTGTYGEISEASSPDNLAAMRVADSAALRSIASYPTA